MFSRRDAFRPFDTIFIAFVASALGCEPASKPSLIVNLTPKQLAEIDPSNKCVMYAIRDVGDKQECWSGGNLIEVRDAGETKQSGMAFVGRSPIGDIGDYECDKWWLEFSQ